MEYKSTIPGGSVGKESACNAGDTGDKGSIPGSGRSLGRGHGKPLQYSCWRIQPGRLQSIGSQELDTTKATEHTYTSITEKAMATHSSTLAWRIPGMGEPGGLLSMGSHRVRHN